MRQVSLPYLTATAESWELGRWQRLDGGPDAELGDSIDDWDYSVPLSLACSVNVDVGRIREEARLAQDDRLVLAAIWEASSTGIRRVGARHELPTCGTASLELLLNLDGSELGGQLTLERQIILIQTVPKDEPLAPHLPGSVLLSERRSERTTVVLEGEASRFPTEVTDFNQTSIAEPAALWSLELDLVDLEQSPLSAMRLYVNGEHPAVRSALTPGDAAGNMVRSVLQWDVARALINRALDIDDFVDEWDTFVEGSVGETLQQLIQRYWPGEDAASLRARRAASPARFEYQLQARLSLLGDAS